MEVALLFGLGGISFGLADLLVSQVETCSRHLKAGTFEPVGPTADNLKSAIAGETYEYTEMYPGFSKTAREEGFPEIGEWLETLARAEKSHAGRFQSGLESLNTLS